METDESLVISESTIQKVQENDKLFSKHMENTRLEIIRVIRAMPGYAKLITDEMREKDVFIATLTKEAHAGLRSGQFEKMLKKDTKLWNGMIRNADGKKEIFEQANWHKVELSSQILSNLTQISMQASVAELTEKILEIDKKIGQLLIYQHSNNKAKIDGGINLYLQAYQSKDIGIRNSQLSNAVQTLNEGRSVLMQDLRNKLSKNLRGPKPTDRFWKVIGVDRRAVDLINDIFHDYDLIKEDIQYINLSTAYLMRIHSLWEQHDSAIEAKNQYIDFCDKLDSGLKQKARYLPYEANIHFSLDMITREFEIAQICASRAFDSNRELVIEIKYEELKDERMQEMLPEHPRG